MIASADVILQWSFKGKYVNVEVQVRELVIVEVGRGPQFPASRLGESLLLPTLAPGRATCAAYTKTKAERPTFKFNIASHSIAALQPAQLRTINSVSLLYSLHQTQ